MKGGYYKNMARERNEQEELTRLEFLGFLLSLKRLLDDNKIEEVKKLINELITEAKKISTKKR